MYHQTLRGVNWIPENERMRLIWSARGSVLACKEELTMNLTHLNKALCATAILTVLGVSRGAHAGSAWGR